MSRPTAAGRGEKFDHCILGEPSNVEVLGDTIKAGRRGSLNGTLVVTGRSGHVAYPERADNPIRGLVTLIAALQAPLDDGSELFAPSNLEFTSVDVGNPTVNVIPGQARARFNIRYNDRHSRATLKALIEKRARVAGAGRVHSAFEWQPSNADVFVTKPSPFTDLAASAIAEVTGRTPKLSTTGGTSDARFIKDYCPVLEFGLVGQTMHQVDECAPVADLVTLTAVYRRIIDRYFGGFHLSPPRGGGGRGAPSLSAILSVADRVDGVTNIASISRPAERPPHPNPLPASGERE